MCINILSFTFFPFHQHLVRGAGYPKKFMRDLGHREVQIRYVLSNTYLGLLHSALEGVVHLTNHFITRVIVERFRVTPNTFHFPVGEITIVPFDFVMLMGRSWIFRRSVSLPRALLLALDRLP